MENLFSWTTLSTIAVVLIVILLAFRLLSRMKLTFRFRGAVTVSPWDQKPCPHLGLLDEPFIHRDEPTEDHRCYLWMQRDRIDLTHQKGFCLSSAHTHCPWLSIAPPLTEGEESSQGLATGVGAKAAHVLAALLNGAAVVWGGIAAALPFVASPLSRVGRVLAAHAPGVSMAIGRALYVVTTYVARKSVAATQAILSRSAKPDLSASPSVELETEIETPQASPIAVPERGPLSHVEGLMEQGKSADMAGNRKLGYTLFCLALDLDPNNDEAWLWRGALSDNVDEKLDCVKRALAINPNNGRALQALQQIAAENEATQTATAGPARRGAGSRSRGGAKARAMSGAPTSETALMEAALAAMETGDEERAYHLLVSATELNPGSEKVWFWRAKAAATLDEVIYCLKQALTINPNNEKVKANLVWAIQRQQKEEQSREAEQSTAAAKEAVTKDQSGPRRSLATMGARLLAATICLAFAAFWVTAALIPMLEIASANQQPGTMQVNALVSLEAVRPIQSATAGWIPQWDWASLPWHDKLEIVSGYNLLEVVPYIIGFLYLFVALGMLRRESWARWWGLGMTILSIALGIAVFANSQATMLLASMGAVAILMLLVSRNEFRSELGEA